jgi:hypothetical protein
MRLRLTIRYACTLDERARASAERAAPHTSRARKNASTTVFFVTTDDLTKPRARATGDLIGRLEYPLMTTGATNPQEIL